MYQWYGLYERTVYTQYMSENNTFRAAQFEASFMYQ